MQTYTYQNQRRLNYEGGHQKFMELALNTAKR